jgi:AcrR family transcriptional regulator
MKAALALGGLSGLHDLSPARIAGEAGVSTDAFLELFADREECFLAALERIAEELLAVASGALGAAEDWPRGVRSAIGEVMHLLSEREDYSRTLACGAFAAGPAAAERNLALARSLAGLLAEGAPAGSIAELSLAGVSGAIWHTLRWHVASGRVELLPAFSDHLSYVVLAPFIGAAPAGEVLGEDAGPVRSAGGWPG